ncbi:MAG: hypothetical protein Q4C53_05005 [Clostridia bacterium]|nr:hypothetical protein [Clostridia bacterium]
MKEQIVKLLSDAAFVRDMNAAKTEDELIVLFSENGVDATFEELSAVITALPGGRLCHAGEDDGVLSYKF